MPAAFPYPAEVEKAMQVMYRSLRENDRRRYAAIEVAKLGHGGTDYIAALLDCDPKTIRRGQADLEQLQARPLEDIDPASGSEKSDCVPSQGPGARSSAESSRWTSACHRPLLIPRETGADDRVGDHQQLARDRRQDHLRPLAPGRESVPERLQGGIVPHRRQRRQV